MTVRAAAARLGGAARTTVDRAAGLAGVRNVAVMAVAGAVGALALPPVMLIPAIFVFALLLLSLDRRQGLRSAFLTGWAFAFGHHVAGLYWISNALLVDGDRFAWAVPFAAAGLPAVLAVFGGLAAGFYRWLRPAGLLRLPVFAGLWTLAEYLRGHVATGFPWNLPASAWGFSDALLQPLSLLGAYGYGFFVILFALAPVLLMRNAGGGLRPYMAAVCLGIPMVFAGFGELRLASAPSLDLEAPTVRVVQGNVPQRDKWKRELLQAHLAKYILLTREPEADVAPAGYTPAQPPRLVVWPETAVPYSLNREPELSDYLGSVLPPEAILMTGAPIREPVSGNSAEIRNFNAVVALDGQGELVARHDKFHLVPFGEYVPFRQWLPLGPVVKTGRGFTPGAGPATISLPGLPAMGALICYEIIFPGAVTAAEGERPGLLVNATNDAWFGHSSGPYQHLVAARMRAAEEGIPVVRAANTGISAVIDSYGRVLASLPLGQTGVIDSPLPAPYPEQTLYARTGNVLALLIAFAAVATGFRRRGQ